MNHSFWLIVIFAAGLASDRATALPRRSGSRETRTIASTETQSATEPTAYRYDTLGWGPPGRGRLGRGERNVTADDPDTFVRIDTVTSKAARPTRRRSMVRPASNSTGKQIQDPGEVVYVPVPLSTRTRTDTKRWPSGVNGIESQDDLHLYNTYTSSVNDKIKPVGEYNPSHVVPYITNKKPSIIIIEELTTRRPSGFGGYPSDPYKPVDVITYRPDAARPSYFGGMAYPTTPRPAYPSVIYPPLEVTHPPPAITRPPVVVTRPPPVTTTKRPKRTCPNVSISATNTIVNANKEGCNDIKINIESTIHNANGLSQADPQSDAPVQSHPVTVTPVVSVTERPEEDGGQLFGLSGFGDFFSSIFTTFSGLSLVNPLSFTFWSALFSPVIIFVAGGVGLAALIIPLLLFTTARSQTRRNRFVILRNRMDRPESNPVPTHLTTVAVVKPETPTRAVPGIEAIAVVARATSDRPSTVVVDAPLPYAMVDADIRTPPKLKEIIQGKTGGVEAGKRPQSLEETGTIVDRIEANGRFELPDASVRASSLPYVASEGKATYQKRKDEDLGVKGIAVPVLMDDVDVETSPPPPKKLQKIPEVAKPVKDEKKKTNNVKPTRESPTTTPSSGLSTWILLSDNRESTTAAPKKANNNNNNNTNKTQTKQDDKKTITTTKKPVKVQATTVTTTKLGKVDATKTNATTKKGVVAVTQKPDNRRVEGETESMSALEAMVKNQKKTAPTVTTTKLFEDTTKMPTQKKPTTAMTMEAKNKPSRINDRMDMDKPQAEVIESRRPATTPSVLLMSTQNPTTVALTDQQGTDLSTTDATVETTTKKKKTGSKKKKKNKNRRRTSTTTATKTGTTGTSNQTQIEQKNVVKAPKQPPVGAQLYNFLSREIMPTVGLGLVGVLVTAGLAGLLGYNPFVSGSLPLRRTYEVQHGYSPNGYYSSYNSDYADGGQSEEILFREVLSGMPEGSRYDLTNTENSYPESQIYSSQDRVYDAMKGQPVEKKYPNADVQYQYPESKTDEGYEEESGTYDATYPQQDYSSSYATGYDSQETSMKNRENGPVYNREVSASYVYPESMEKSSRLNDEYDTSGMETSTRYGADKLSSKYSKTKTDTIERQPEALYRVAGDYDHVYRAESTVQGISSQNSWHRIGSAMDYQKYTHLEPGPRSLNFTKEEILSASDPKKRAKRAAESVIQRIARKQTNADKDIENEIDVDDDGKSRHPAEQATQDNIKVTSTTEPATEATPDDASTTEADYEVIEANPIAYNFLDVLKRLAQFKLKIGLSFLKSTTDAFSRYLDVIQKRVDESITNTTLVYRIRSDEEGTHRRRRRSAKPMKKRTRKDKRMKKASAKAAGKTVTKMKSNKN